MRDPDRRRWDDFAAEAPELAGIGRELFDRHELCMVGTLRRDRSPRISPCELDFAEGELFLGMMWQSPKARDLLRDPRCVLHSCTQDRSGTEGDFKLYGRASDIQAPHLRDAYRAAIKARIDWEPAGSFHLFAIDVTSSGYVVFGEHGFAMAWDPQRGLRRWEQREDGS
jgi:Pyridoxamine 5'-phosphate oxidase